jgi:hypothetical protein
MCFGNKFQNGGAPSASAGERRCYSLDPAIFFARNLVCIMFICICETLEETRRISVTLQR